MDKQKTQINKERTKFVLCGGSGFTSKDGKVFKDEGGVNSTQIDEFLVCMDLYAGGHNDKFISGMSDGAVCVHAFPSLEPITSIKAHTESLTSLVYTHTSPHIFISSSYDGCVKLWDSRLPKLHVHTHKTQPNSSTIEASNNRTKKHTQETSSEEENTNDSIAIHAVTSNADDKLIAYAQEEYIHLLDIRQLATNQNHPSTQTSKAYKSNKNHSSAITTMNNVPQTPLLQTFSIHSDAVTSIIFHPHIPHLLFSAAEDGLVSCLSTLPSVNNNTQTAQHTNEELTELHEGLLTSFYVEDTIQSISLLGPKQDIISCNSLQQTQVWELTGLSNFNNSSHIENWWETDPHNSVPTSSNLSVQCDRRLCYNFLTQTSTNKKPLSYAINTLTAIHQKNPHILNVLGGSMDGDLGLLKLNLNKNLNRNLMVIPFENGPKGAPFKPHKSIVRCSRPIINDGKTTHILTGGEDGRLCIWEKKKTNKKRSTHPVRIHKRKAFEQIHPY